MSLSSNTGGTGLHGEAWVAYQMECFDGPGPSSASKTDSCVFEAFCDSDNCEVDVFQYMSSDGRESAKEVAGKAAARVEEIVAEAKNKASSIERDSYEKGFAQGEKDGQEMGTKKLEKVLERIHQALQEIVAYKQEFIKLHEKETLDLVCRIAEKIVRGRVKIDRGIIRETIFEALNLVADRSEVTVKVSPEDIEYVKELRPEFFDRITDLKSITMEPDPSISPGGCAMETAFGHVNARLESQLEKITAAVMQTFEEENAQMVNRQS
jgi:flagellar assembly protein FliH